MTELCLLLEQAGTHACPVPLLATLVMAALPIATWGTDAQKKELLVPMMRGSSILTAALVESASPVRAERRNGAWVLRGSSSFVPYLRSAARVLLPARTETGMTAVFVVDPSSTGAVIDDQIGTSGALLGALSLGDVVVSDENVLGDPSRGEEIVAFALERTYLAQCALELGLASGALELTAKYTATRQQFGRPIGTFQAVAQRAADAYIDVETIRLTLQRALFLVDGGHDAVAEIAVAKMIAGLAGHRVVCAAQHLHGGMGFDRDYPLHRYFLASKQNEFSFGSASFHEARLGRLIAAEATEGRPGGEGRAR